MYFEQSKVDTRYPKWVHDQLVVIANEQGCSVNTIIKRLVKERVIEDIKARN